MHNIVTLIRSVLYNNQKRIFRKMFIQTIYKILYYDRIHVSEGIGVNKTSVSKELLFVTISIF